MQALHIFADSATVPVRKSDSDSAEMVTQLLLGETALVLSITERWVEILCDHDAYHGWVNKSQVGFLVEEAYQEWLHHPKRVRSQKRAFMIENMQGARCVPAGALLVVNDDDMVALPNGEYATTIQTEAIMADSPMETALNLLGAPYLWGGRSEYGIDCSGLVQLCYALHGMDVPRDARDQCLLGGHTGTSIDKAKEGDLLYFGPEEGVITHVGFYLGNGTLLHASGNVKMNNISHKHRFVNHFPFDEALSKKLLVVQSGAQFPSMAAEWKANVRFDTHDL